MLEKSLYLFTNKGFSNVNMRQIAAEIGVSTGTLYHYFSSKENILVEMLAWLGDKNVDEYTNRTSSVESIHDRFNMIVDFWKEKGELYKNILLLAIDVYRNVDSEQWKEVYSFFSERYTDGMSERLNISQQFARSIFIYFIGLAFHSLAFDGISEYNEQIDFLETIFRPLIVDAPEDREQALYKIQEVISKMLMKTSVTEKTTAARKKIKKTKIKKAKIKRKT
jgi:AcrR family transcriptional regulator